MRVLHFADAHIDMQNYGRHDPQSGLPVRVMDFLKSLDTIVDTAINEKVDMVLFAGDAYRDRNPAPTFQREWGRRIMRLSRAGIPTLLLVGNHDLSPSLGRAHALESFDTLEVPHVRVIASPLFLKPADLEGLPVQILALPWIARSGMLAHLGLSSVQPDQIYVELEKRLIELVAGWLAEVDPDLPVILSAHASVQGARFGNERTVMLGDDLVLSRSLVCDPRLDYVALGHIHRPQDLNEKGNPHVIYPGSIERVDAGEVNDEKSFVIAHIERGNTTVEWRKLTGVRPFYVCSASLDNIENIQAQIRAALPEPALMQDAILRLTLEYPREWEAMLDEAWLHQYVAGTFEFILERRPQMESRIRLPQDQAFGSLTSLELLELYWRANHTADAEQEILHQLASQVIADVQHGVQ